MEIVRQRGPSGLNTAAPTSAQWDQHRSLITELYVQRGMGQKQIAEVMLDSHGFQATEKMYMQRFCNWKINKKMSVQDARAILSALARRKAAGRRVKKIRLRQHEVTSTQAQTSLKRRKLDVSAPNLSSQHEAKTPSEISVVSEDDENHCEKSPQTSREAYAGVITDVVASRRPRSPSLVGDERFEIFFIHKMRDWHLGSTVHNFEHGRTRTTRYLIDLDAATSSPDALSYKKAIWLAWYSATVFSDVFRSQGFWLVSTLIGIAVVLSRTRPSSHSIAENVRLNILQSAKRSAAEASQHPLLVLCSVLFGSEHKNQFETNLRRCSTLVQQIHGVGSLEHDTIDAARAACLEHLGRHGDAALLLSALIDSMRRNPLRPPEAVHLKACQLARVHACLGEFSKAEAGLFEPLEYCNLAAGQRNVTITEMGQPLTDLFDYALSGLGVLERLRGDFASAEFRARQRLEFCEQAFGTKYYRATDAYYGLKFDLEAQNKFHEVDELQRKWQHIIDPPGSFEVPPTFAARFRDTEDDDEMSINESDFLSDHEPPENDLEEPDGFYADQSELDAETGPSAAMNEDDGLAEPDVLGFQESVFEGMDKIYNSGSDLADAAVALNAATGRGDSAGHLQAKRTMGAENTLSVSENVSDGAVNTSKSHQRLQGHHQGPQARCVGLRLRLRLGYLVARALEENYTAQSLFAISEVGSGDDDGNADDAVQCSRWQYAESSLMCRSNVNGDGLQKVPGTGVAGSD